jgi:hypothetical protein
VGDYRIIVELPGITDEERARNIIEQQAFLELKLVRTRTPLMQALPRMDRAVLAALGPESGCSARRIPRQPTRRLRDTTAAPPARSPAERLLRGGDADGEIMVASRM